jgi:hypothetical protein
MDNEDDLAKMTNAVPGEVVNLSEPSKAIVVRCPILEELIKSNELDWPDDHRLTEDQEKVLIPLFRERQDPIQYAKQEIFCLDFSIEPAFSITFHVQGKTLTKVIFDLNQRPSELGHLTISSIFVGMSRVKNADSIRILPAHNAQSFNYLTKLQYSPDLRAWTTSCQ